MLKYFERKLLTRNRRTPPPKRCQARRARSLENVNLLKLSARERNIALAAGLADDGQEVGRETAAPPGECV
jgi:hypothetical protein